MHISHCLKNSQGLQTRRTKHVLHIRCGFCNRVCCLCLACYYDCNGQQRHATDANSCMREQQPIIKFVVKTKSKNIIDAIYKCKLGIK